MQTVVTLLENVFKIHRANFKILEKALKLENYPKIITGVLLRKNLVLRIASKKINETFWFIKT